jgi:ankyrin repeat protein
MKQLIDNHCDVNVISSDGNTALILAASYGSLECMKLLIRNHCDVNVRNNNENTALILAVCNGHSECKTTY